MTGAALGLGLAVVAVAAHGAWRSHRELARWRGRDPYTVRRIARAVLLALGTGLLGLGLARSATAPPRAQGAGLDAVVVIDVSRSMDARDVAPSRLRRALRLAERLVGDARATRFGLVIFAGDAFTALPLTFDRDAHLAYLAALDTAVLSQRGSDLARALRAARDAFDPRSSRPRAVVLLSDGEHAGSDLAGPLAALESAGAPITAVGFGGRDGAVVPGPGGRPLVDREGHTVVSRRDDAVLERAARSTGGRYYRESEDAPAPGALLHRPDARPSSAPVDGLRGALLGALILLAAELLLGARARSPRPPRAARSPVALAAAAAALLALGPPSTLERGDARLAEGAAGEALALYRRAERARGFSPATRIRVGNARYRLAEPERAAGAYLEALRRVEPDDSAARFAASFNLGNALVDLGRFEEARESYWTALVERPDSLEAKFNYEWASERAPLQTPTDGGGEPGPEPVAGGGEGSGPPGSAPAEAPAGRGRRAQRELTPEEVERWLAAIDDALDRPLRSQAARATGRRSEGRGGQSW